MMTRSSAYRSSQQTPAQNSRDNASSTMMESKGLSMDPWYTPTFTSNSWLKPSPTRTQLRKLAYIPWTNSTIHSSTPGFLRAHQKPSKGHGQMFSLGPRKPYKASCSQLGIFPASAGPQRLHL